MLKYKVITSEQQLNQYCKILYDLVFSEHKSKEIEEEIDLLTLLIETWDEEHYPLGDIAPIPLLQSIMDDHKMKAKDLADLLGVSKGYVSDILNYKKGMSKEVIRKLAERFKIRQDAFNQPYDLVNAPAKKSARVKNIKKKQLKKAI